mmetsp:Transcript_25222/g.29193  ORF Transcript_25222/g.29193 Transcript_25222/m.29193 type:complete len:101 (-) Transcript_25222:84-386(-)
MIKYIIVIQNIAWLSYPILLVQLDLANSILDVGKDGTNIIWNKLKIEFNVSKDSVRSTQTFFQTFAKDIARENLEGQCTNGHSCKKSSEHKLKKLIDGDG